MDFMDDLTVTTTVSRARWILQRLERNMVWACMSSKPAKSRSLVLKKASVTDKFCFRLREHLIPMFQIRHTGTHLKQLLQGAGCGLL